ncbi:MAG: hypothetical protein JRC87_05950 [Deltaproteobacteria bacterium]|nr:hypothetical protein [Deltaproteobacteria bacterium]
MPAITPLLYLSSVDTATSQQQKSGRGDNFLSAGQIFKALVLEEKGAGTFLLDISGRHISAKSNTVLTPGQTLQLQVISTTPQIELKIITSSVNLTVTNSLTLLNKNIDLTGLIQALTEQSTSPTHHLPLATKNIVEQFHSLQMEPLSGRNSGSVLEGLINKIGLSFEKSLANGDLRSAGNSLKAALSEIAAIFAETSSIKESASGLLTIIELFQLAQINSTNDRQLILPLPLPFLEQGYLTVQYDQNHAQGEDSNSNANRFSLHLTMSQLGNIQVDFLQMQDVLYIRFRTDSQYKAEFVALFSEQLKETLTAVPQIMLTFSADAPDPMTDLIRHIIPDGDTLVNIRA